MMAKFTIYFKDKLIQTHFANNGVVHIGRDNTNTIMIDSLAVAPIHAVVVVSEASCLIKQVNNEFPLIINDHPQTEYFLQSNDQISIGKHEILFTDASQHHERTNSESSLEIDDDYPQLEANLQVIDGKHIGRIIPIKKAITRLGKSGEGVVIISKRREGYFISALENNINLTINQKTLDDQIVKLSHHDQICIDNVSMQFYLV